MDDRRAVEGIVRDFFESPDTPADLATGKLETFLRLPEVPVEGVEAVETVSFRRLTAREIQGDVAVVDLDGLWKLDVEAPSFGQIKGTRHIGGPVALQRIDGAWKVADYVLNGRRRCESIVIDPSGTQDSAELTLTIRTADLQGDGTSLYAALTNRREAAVKWNWAALGVPRRSSWRFEELGLIPMELPTGGPHIVYLWGPPVPLGTRKLRLILGESRRRATFDLVVRLDSSRHDLTEVQRAPDSLPLRLRLARSPLALLPLVPLVGVVLLLGGLAALGVMLLALGAFTVGAALWHRSRGRPVFLLRAMVLAGTAFALGALLLWVADS